MQLELAFLERRPVDPDDGSNGPWDRIDPQAQIVSGGEDPRINGAGFGHLASVCCDDAAVLAAVQHASRRLRRCPAGMLDRRCARRAEGTAGRDGGMAVLIEQQDCLSGIRCQERSRSPEADGQMNGAD